MRLPSYDQLSKLEIDVKPLKEAVETRKKKLSKLFFSLCFLFVVSAIFTGLAFSGHFGAAAAIRGGCSLVGVDLVLFIAVLVALSKRATAKENIWEDRIPKELDKLIDDWLSQQTLKDGDKKTIKQRIHSCVFYREETLDLNALKLTELPAWLANVPGLQHLNVADNQLTEIPAGFDELRRLYASNNNLTKIPEGFQNLEELDVSKNPEFVKNGVETVPVSVLKLTMSRPNDEDTSDVPETYKSIIDWANKSNNKCTVHLEDLEFKFDQAASAYPKLLIKERNCPLRRPKYLEFEAPELEYMLLRLDSNSPLPQDSRLYKWLAEQEQEQRVKNDSFPQQSKDSAQTSAEESSSLSNALNYRERLPKYFSFLDKCAEGLVRKAEEIPAALYNLHRPSVAPELSLQMALESFLPGASIELRKKLYKYYTSNPFDPNSVLPDIQAASPFMDDQDAAGCFDKMFAHFAGDFFKYSRTAHLKMRYLELCLEGFGGYQAMSKCDA